MEIVAMDMKVSGMYIARQLSFSGVSFCIEEIALDDDFTLVYNKAAKLVSANEASLISLSFTRTVPEDQTEESEHSRGSKCD